MRAAGIGFGAAQYFVRLGGEVIVTSRTQSKVDAAVKALGPKATGYAVDGTNEEQVRARAALYILRVPASSNG